MLRGALHSLLAALAQPPTAQPPAAGAAWQAAQAVRVLAGDVLLLLAHPSSAHGSAVQALLDASPEWAAWSGLGHDLFLPAGGSVGPNGVAGLLLGREAALLGLPDFFDDEST